MQLQTAWKKRLMRGHFPNAIVLTGEKRESLANTLAAAYLCEDEGEVPCGHCRSCRKVEGGIHPDVFVTNGPDALKVDAVRALRSDAYIRPNEAEHKIYILTDADSMNQSAQNALLKLLEEGPDYAAFFFLCKNPETLLITLRSRCECFQAESEETLQEIPQEVRDFVNLLCVQDEEKLPLVTFCVALEKKTREELSRFLDQSMEVLVAQLSMQPHRLLPRVDALRTVRAACDYTVGVGHLCGWLMAELID